MNKKQTEILLLGSFHFLEEEGVDIYSPSTQSQLQKLTESLFKFNPDKIAIEGLLDAEDAILKAYEDINLSDFSNIEKMRISEYGYFLWNGMKCPITFLNESIQIGFRLGKMLKKDRIYPIDYLENYDEGFYKTAVENLPLWDVQRREYWKEENDRISSIKSNGDIIELYRYFNTLGYVQRQHELFYLLPNVVGAGENYEGADFLASWYKRNLRIFANLQRLTKDCECIFVLYGAGHLHILRELINSCSNMKLVEIMDYLKD